MKWTSVLAVTAKRAGTEGQRQQRRAASSYQDSNTKRQPQRSVKALALSVYFKQPDFGMKDFEILSRASAYLLGVDAPDPQAVEGSPYGHLEVAERRRHLKQYMRGHKYSPAGGPAGRNMMDLSWLEFVPRELRPQVHVVASSHVLSPFLWRDYYPQDWLSHVRQEHCAYCVEVYDPEQPQNEALCKLALNPEPFHHPEGMDLSLIHFKEEQSSLKILKNLGVEILQLRDPDKLYQKGEDMIFDGYVVSERNPAENQEFGKAPEKTPEEEQDREKVGDEDLRIFYPHQLDGKLAFHTNDRFYATTPDPLQEGFCGAPVLDKDGDLCGTVIGIVPVNHKDERLAGSAAFVPSQVMRVFIDFVERWMVERMMPEDLFSLVKSAKQTNSIGAGVFQKDESGNIEETEWEDAYDAALATLKKRYSQEEVDAILDKVRREREEVLDIFNKEGGDLDEIIQQVRSKALEMRELVHDQFRKGQVVAANEDERSKA